jgi:hypothetical protein
MTACPGPVGVNVTVALASPALNVTGLFCMASTLLGIDKSDTTTLDEMLCEAGMAVGALAGREAELRPDDTPKVNDNGIEELLTDKGNHSGVVVKRVKSYEVRSYIPEKLQKGQRNWQGKAEEQRAVY